MNVRYTDKDDERIRAAFAFPTKSRERAIALAELSEEMGASVEALRSRFNLLQIRAGQRLPDRRNRLPFTVAEDAALLALGWRPTQAAWTTLSERTQRPISSLRHRRLKLRKHVAVVRPDQEPRFRIQLPVSTPIWFEHQITRDRLMAGR